jgi:hypothetical protein
MSVAAPPSPGPAAARRQMIANRQQRSAIWWIIHRLGSLNFALVLLATIAIACAVATFAESGFSAKIARAYIYKNPLFLFWLGALCVNLFAVTLTRWPWEKRHAGFVITHYGIITLLIGAVIGMTYGFEGNVTLEKDAPPVSRVTTSRSVIWLSSSADSAYYLDDFDAETIRPSAKKPRSFPVPHTNLTIVADDFSPNLVREPRLVPSETPGAGPAVLLKLSSTMAGQTLDLPLTLANGQPAEEDFFGMARIAFHPTLPAAEPKDQETRMVFAKFAPVVQPGAPSSGVTVRLSEDGEKVTILSPSGVGATYQRKDIVGRAVTEAGATVVVENYWPDFAMENGKPTTRSETPNNPAALVRISQTTPEDAKPVLEVAPAENGIRFQLRRGGHVYASGAAGTGESFSLGWADWQAEVNQVLPRAEITRDVGPGPELPKGQQGIPGFRAHLVSADGKRGPDKWVESGQLVSLTDGRIDVRVGYGLEPQNLPFSIRLLNFEVPRDEGTDTPADFRATVEFRDSKTGTTKTGLARMNQPASFPGTLQANLTGINYKFSQAEWNPRDLDETTLQVLYDPGWMLKWIGSLAICIGIAIMFYWKPKAG